jgi:hypothetical protein
MGRLMMGWTVGIEALGSPYVVLEVWVEKKRRGDREIPFVRKKLNHS